MSTDPKEGHATQMISDEEAARAAVSTMQTADYGPDDELAAGVLAKTASEKTRRHHDENEAGATASDHDDGAVTSKTLGDAMLTADEDVVRGDGAGGGGRAGDPEATAHEQQPAPTAVRHDDDRAALDAKIRAHLDRDAPRPSTDPLIGSVIGGRFEVTSKLGAGGMGAVYRAKQQGIDRFVAIKVLLQELTTNETLIRRFTIEALAVSRLKHPNTIQIFDFGKTDGGNLYIAMELLEGETLYARHARQRRLPVRHALRIVGQVAASLAEAHGKGIIHRDLKPENIFLTRVGDDPDFVKVLDFGVAKLRDGDGDGKGTLTQAGSIFGTPRYMSPEQASAQPVDARSDVYALGVILYELVVGHAPFVSDTPLTLLLAHVHDDVPSPSAASPDLAIPLEVEELILTLLEKAPVDRIQTAGELSEACLRLAATLPAAFDRAVDLAEAASLGVALSAPATVHVAMQGLPSDTVSINGSPTMVDGAQSRSSSWMWVALLGLLISAGVGGLVWMKSTARGAAVDPSRGTPSTDASVAAPIAALSPDVVETAPASTDVSPTLVRVQITTVPPGANILLVGTPGTLLGTTPLPLERVKNTKLTLRLERDGFASQDLALNFEENTTVKLVLARKVTTSAATAPKKAPKRRRKPTVKRRRAASVKKPAAPKKPAAVAPKKPAKKPPGLVGDLM